MKTKLSALLLNLAPVYVFANNASSQICTGAATTCDNSSTTSSLAKSIGTITTVLLTVAGAIAVIIIIIGGLTYIASSGDAARTKQAKDTIFYAIIGLVVAILAYAIVNFVAGNIK